MHIGSFRPYLRLRLLVLCTLHYIRAVCFNHNNRLVQLRACFFSPAPEAAARQSHLYLGCRSTLLLPMSFMLCCFFGRLQTTYRVRAFFGFRALLMNAFPTENTQPGKHPPQNPRAGPTFNAVGNAMRGCAVDLWLNQAANRQVSAQARHIDGALFFLWFRQVSLRAVAGRRQPRQGKAH